MFPNIYSADTMTGPGQCKTLDFNNKLFSIKAGKKQVSQTGEQQLAWLQLDLGSYFDLVEVYFESGAAAAETYNVRVARRRKSLNLIVV